MPNDESINASLSFIYSPKPAKTIAILSGNPGAGKSTVALNLALSLAQKKKRVLLIDSVGTLQELGLVERASITMAEVLKNECRLHQALMKGPDKNIIVLPGSEECLNFSIHEYAGLIHSFSTIEAVEYIIVDIPTGVTEFQLSFLRAVEEILFVLTEELLSLVDTVQLLKIVKEKCYKNYFHVLVNRSLNVSRSRFLLKKLYAAIDDQIDCVINSVGKIPFTPAMLDTLTEKKALVSLYPENEASRAFKRLSSTISNWPLRHLNGNTGFFIERFIAG